MAFRFERSMVKSNEIIKDKIVDFIYGDGGERLNPRVEIVDEIATKVGFCLFDRLRFHFLQYRV